MRHALLAATAVACLCVAPPADAQRPPYVRHYVPMDTHAMGDAFDRAQRMDEENAELMDEAYRLIYTARSSGTDAALERELSAAEAALDEIESSRLLDGSRMRQIRRDLWKAISDYDYRVRTTASTSAQAPPASCEGLRLNFWTDFFGENAMPQDGWSLSSEELTTMWSISHDTILKQATGDEATVVVHPTGCARYERGPHVTVFAFALSDGNQMSVREENRPGGTFYVVLLMARWDPAARGYTRHYVFSNYPVRDIRDLI